jgi:hypothetical protein
MTPIFRVILWPHVLHSLRVYKHRGPSKWSNVCSIQQRRSTLIVLQDLQLRHSYFSVFPVRCQDCPLSLFFYTNSITFIQRFSVFKFVTGLRIGCAKCLSLLERQKITCISTMPVKVYFPAVFGPEYQSDWGVTLQLKAA